MARVSFAIFGAREARRKLDALGIQGTLATRRILLEAAEEEVEKLQREAPVASGKLSRSGTIEVETDSEGLLGLRVSADVDYASYVRFGFDNTRKMPPVEQIRKWLIAKGIKPQTPPSRSKPQTRRSQAWKVATVISDKSPYRGKKFFYASPFAIGTKIRRKLEAEYSRIAKSIGS